MFDITRARISRARISRARITKTIVIAFAAMLTLSLGGVFATGTATAEQEETAGILTAQGGPNLIIVTIDKAAEGKPCAITVKKLSGTPNQVTHTVTAGAGGKVADTFVNREPGEHNVTAVCDGKALNGTSVHVTAPVNQCVQIVHDIAWALGLRGNELAVVMSIARTYCPR